MPTINFYVSDAQIEQWWKNLPRRERSKTVCDLIRNHLSGEKEPTNSDILAAINRMRSKSALNLPPLKPGCPY